ncbi:MAG: hypothetical protein ACM3YE_10615 [Bacteroidota bacterium]
MKRVEVLNHKGREIVYLDFSNLEIKDWDEFKATIENAKNVIKNYPPASAYTLVNFTNLRFSTQFLAELKELTFHNKPYVKNGAVFGVQGLQKVVFDAVMRITGRDLPIFNSKEEGMDWLSTV